MNKERIKKPEFKGLITNLGGQSGITVDKIMARLSLNEERRNASMTMSTSSGSALYTVKTTQDEGEARDEARDGKDDVKEEIKDESKDQVKGGREEVKNESKY